MPSGASSGIVAEMGHPPAETGQPAVRRAAFPPTARRPLGPARILAIILVGVLLGASLVSLILPESPPCGPPHTCVLGDIDAGFGPSAMLYDNASGRIYVLDSGPGVSWGVTVINGSTDTVVGFYPMTQRSTAMTYDSGNGDLYLTSFLYNDIYVLNASTGANVTWIGTPPPSFLPGLGAIAYDPVTGFVIALDLSSILVINGSTNLVVSDRNLGVASYPLGVNPATGQVFVITSLRGGAWFNLTVLDGSTFSVEGSTQLNGTPQEQNLVFDSLNDRIYVAAYTFWYGEYNGSLLTLDEAGAHVLSSTQVGNNPYGVAIDTSNGYVYVTNTYSNNASVINGTSNQVVGSIPLDPDPWSIVYDGRNGCLYALFYAHFNSGASSQGDGYLSVIAPPGSACLAPPTSWSPPVWTDLLIGAVFLAAVVVASSLYRRRPRQNDDSRPSSSVTPPRSTTNTRSDPSEPP